MSGNLYQLRSRVKLWPGAYVKVNGPYDIYGRVLDTVAENAPAAEAVFGVLYLIRGIGNSEEALGKNEIAAEL